MSVVSTISAKEAYPVHLGEIVIYCEHFKAAGTRVFAEKSTVNGETLFSNTNKKALRITLEGRIYDEASPLGMLYYCDGFMAEDTAFTVEYRGITFSECHVQSFTAEDKGEDFIYASITLITPERSAQSEEDSDGES